MDSSKQTPRARPVIRRLRAIKLLTAVLSLLAGGAAFNSNAAAETLQVGFAQRDITPDVKAENVWLAGYGHGRKAESVHDPIFVRAMVVSDGQKKLAIAAVDLVGLQYPQVLAIRKQLPDLDYVLVASTHNHEGPDVIGLWGRTAVNRGVDKAYLKRVVEQSVAAIGEAVKNLQSATARWGTAADADLVKDSRKPIVKDDRLDTLTFYDERSQPLGVLLKWSVHPEAMGSRNKQLTADFPKWMIDTVQTKHDCPVVFVVGAIGGLLAPPNGGILGENGDELKPGSFEFTAAYGRLCGQLALRSIEQGKPLTLTPFAFHARRITLPVDNLYYRAARAMKIISRTAYEWTGDAEQLGPPLAGASKAKMAIATEVALLRLGELSVPCIPGEIYPELVFGKVADPPEANVDFPMAEVEPDVASMMPTPKWMLIGLANDEVGYILPKRQWDQTAPFAYGRATGQYGEINSCGPDVARVLLDSLRKCADAAADKR